MLHQSESLASEQNERLIAQWKRMADSMEKSIEQNLAAIDSAADANRRNIEASNSQNRDLVNASVRQSRTSLQATIDNFHQEQRAWLAAGDETYTIAETGPVESSVSVTNTGKTPAINITCRMTGND